MSTLSVGIIGLGYWGPNLLRNFRSLESCRVTAMADTDPARLAEAARLNSDIRTYSNADELIADDAVEAVVLALPAALLPELAIRALEHGKHVIVEKPMAASVEDGRRLAKAADGSGRVVMVDFTFVYSPAVQHLRELVETDDIGAPQYYQSTRINLGRFQPDVDVVWDLVVHDVAILAYVLGRDPVRVLASGRGPNPTGPDTAHVTLFYDDGFQAFVHVSWLAPTKVRTALLAGRSGMVIYDDVNADEKLRVYRVDSVFDPTVENPLAPTYRLGDVRIPRLTPVEPLRTMAAAFVDAATGGPPPITDAGFGLRVLSVLEAARRSLREGVATTVERPA